jgi:flagellar motor switch protein FliN
MKTFMECWSGVAAELLTQALAGEPELSESLPKPFTAGSFGFAATLAGDEGGRFAVVLDNLILDTPLMGEGVDQKSAWGELVRETMNAAAGELLAKTGKKCKVEKFDEIAGENKYSQAFQLRTASRAWTIMVRDEVRPAPAKAAELPLTQTGKVSSEGTDPQRNGTTAQQPGSALSPGLELLLDIELEASLRFGSREMQLGEILDLGPGDVVQLDRQVTDTVDLIVGDKIVARGDVVLVNGNFGLRITEVSAPRKRLESIRCLF